MTVIARRISATPARSASEAWAVMVNLVAPNQQSNARKELESVSGIASNLIADEAFNGAAAVIYGSGPRIRLYCLYGDKAISAEGANESAFAFIPTEGDWLMSLPCPTDDLGWVQEVLKQKSTRITARSMYEVIQDSDGSEARKSQQGFELNMEAFLNS